MLHNFADSYIVKDGIDPGEQSGCIEAFFDESDPYWKELGYVPFNGSDEESKTMISHALNTFEYPTHIRIMLESWKEEGF